MSSSRPPHPTRRPNNRDDDYADVAAQIAQLRDLDPESVRFDSCRTAVISRCLPLADHIALRFGGRGADLDDLVQVARVGLVNAVDRFDPSRGADFLSFAVPTVMGEVRRYFRDATWSLRVPRRAKETSLQVAKVSDALLQQLGRSPRPGEIASAMDIDIDQVVEGLVARSAYHAASIDAVFTGESSTMRLHDTLGCLDERMDRVDDIATLRPALQTLDARERRIIGLRFFESMSQSQIADTVGISQMHVSRILSRTLTRLRTEIVGADVA